MKLEPVTKLDKRNKATSKKKLTITSCWQIVASLSFSRFIASLDQSEVGFWTHSSELTSLLTVTFYLTKTENKTTKSLTQLSHY